jgi:hypothetical protein
MPIEPQPLPPELPGPGEDIPPGEITAPTDPPPAGTSTSFPWNDSYHAASPIL